MICIACVIILSIGQSKAFRFRDSSTIRTTSSINSGVTPVQGQKRQIDSRVVSTVLQVSALFLACSVKVVGQGCKI